MNNSKLFSRIRYSLIVVFTPVNVLILLAILSLLPVLAVRFLPLLDYPVWIYQSHVLSNVQAFSDHFYISWLPVPNLGSTLPMLVLTPLLGAELAAKVLVLVNAFFFVIGYAYYVKGVSPAQAGIVYLGAAIVYNIFFIDGYLSFYLGLTLILFVFGFILRLPGPITWKNVIFLSLLSVGAYLFHLVIWFPIFIYIVITGVLKRQTIRWLISQIIPLILFLIYALTRIGQEDIVIRFHQDLRNKIFALVSPLLPFQRIDPFPSKLPILGLNLFVLGSIAVVVVIGLLKYKKNGGLFIPNRSPLVFTIAFLFAIGVLNPFMWIGGMVEVDQRLVFIAALLAFPVLISHLRITFPAKLGVFLSLVVILVNLVSFRDIDRQLNTVQHALKQIPTGTVIYAASFRNYPIYGECERKTENFGNGIFPLLWFPLYNAMEDGVVAVKTFDTALLRVKPQFVPDLIVESLITQQSREAFLERMKAVDNSWNYVVIFRCPGDAIGVVPSWDVIDSGEYFDIYAKEAY